MPIYSENEIELEERLASVFAGAAATSSLAASAAASLEENPDKPLSPRLNAALVAMLRVVQGVATLDISKLQSEEDGVSLPEELVARLARTSGIRDDVSDDGGSGALTRLVNDLRELLESPSREPAGRVAEFLGQLSEVENTQAQALARGSLEPELFVSAYPIGL